MGLQTLHQQAHQCVSDLIEHRLLSDEIIRIQAGGSLARGSADQYSDIELVFISESEQASFINEQLKKLPRVGTLENLLEINQLYYQSTQLDCIFMTRSEYLELCHFFAEAPRVDPGFQAIIAAQINPTVYYQRAEAPLAVETIIYSQSYAQRVIAYGLKQILLNNLSIHFARQDFVMLQHSLLNFTRGYLIILFALNYQFLAGYKHLEHQIQKLEEAPQQIWQRLQELPSLSPTELFKAMQDLWHELVQLAQAGKHFSELPPTLDFNSLRQTAPRVNL